jgi:manganese/zinc/iron transport system substrate-binding protein
MKWWWILLAVLMSAGCSDRKHGPSIADRPIRVVTTTGMIADAAQNVGAGRVDVQALMGPGTDPHLYKATAGDVRTLDGADIILYNGLELEGRMAEVFASMQAKRPVVAVAENVTEDKLIALSAGKKDPHVWFDVHLWKQVVESVRDALIDLDPDHSEKYNENTRQYLSKLDELDAWAKREFESIPRDQRVLVTAHDAFGYLGKRYGIEVLAIQGVSTATEASAADIRRLADVLSTRKIKALFVESSVPQSTIEALQQAVKSRGWNIELGGELFSDAMGAPGTEEGTYIGMFRHNVRTIVEALR